ncbi:hypothetical protein M5689_019749 [Euphorbia peplus]|nr:hypothetical protein M5689_019749 [Euphorbia peplus]
MRLRSLKSSPPQQIPAHIEAPSRIQSALDSLFYLKNSRNFINWFGFFESSLFSYAYLIFITLLFIGVMAVFSNFEIYEEFGSEHNVDAFFHAGAPLFLLLLLNFIPVLTFARGANEDKLWSFVMVSESNSDAVEDIDERVTRFSNDFCDKISNFRLFVGVFALIAIASKLAIDSQRMSHHASLSHYVFIIVLWCYLCIGFVIRNGLLYIAAESCKIYVSIYKHFFTTGSSSISNLPPLFEHYKRLIKIVEKQSKIISWCVVSQMAICSFSTAYTLVLPRVADLNRQGDFWLGVADFWCLIIAEIPVVWTTLLVLKNLTVQIESIDTIAHEK